MKIFDRFIVLVSLAGLLMILAVNFMIFRSGTDSDKFYRIEVNRIKNELIAGNEINTENYTAILGVYEYDGGNFYSSENEYVICDVNGTLYRIEYNDKTDDKSEIKLISCILPCIFLIAVVSVLLYIRHNIINPFSEISDYPYRLAKGTLSVPLKESKRRYFGKFIWGLDMLRETLEKSQVREMERARKEKTFLMSMSHDIKTPLSAIKLYSKAIAKGLYTGEKQIETAENINVKADEIEKLVNEIIRNLNDEFMAFEVNQTEFYMSQVIEKVKAYYSDKLCSTGTDFVIEKYTDCLLSGDPDRLEEVLQNIIENAVKYGDGHHISLSFSSEEDCRLITVSNSGCTLSDAEIPHIFDSFWRGANSQNKHGCGLGLYICRHLANAMGGDVFAEISGDFMNVTVVCRKFY